MRMLDDVDYTSGVDCLPPAVVAVLTQHRVTLRQLALFADALDVSVDSLVAMSKQELGALLSTGGALVDILKTLDWTYQYYLTQSSELQKELLEHSTEIVSLVRHIKITPNALLQLAPPTRSFLYQNHHELYDLIVKRGIPLQTILLLNPVIRAQLIEKSYVLKRMPVGHAARFVEEMNALERNTETIVGPYRTGLGLFQGFPRELFFNVMHHTVDTTLVSWEEADSLMCDVMSNPKP